MEDLGQGVDPLIGHRNDADVGCRSAGRMAGFGRMAAKSGEHRRLAGAR
jgi:hypothetical protein